jgi:hypothetical protein
MGWIEAERRREAGWSRMKGGGKRKAIAEGQGDGESQIVERGGGRSWRRVSVEETGRVEEGDRMDD